MAATDFRNVRPKTLRQDGLSSAVALSKEKPFSNSKTGPKSWGFASHLGDSLLFKGQRNGLRGSFLNGSTVYTLANKKDMVWGSKDIKVKVAKPLGSAR